MIAMDKKKEFFKFTGFADNANIRYEERNGANVMIVPSKTLPDNIVMNRTLFPASTIENGYMTLERRPASLGHPEINGVEVSALDPEGLNQSWVGGWNENVRRVQEEDGSFRVHNDIIIDTDVAMQSDKGRKLITAVNKKQPIHTSIGVWMYKVEAKGESGGKEYDYIAKEILFDHNAILLDIDGAATPEDGVGLFVNSEQLTNDKKCGISTDNSESLGEEHMSKEDKTLETANADAKDEAIVTNSDADATKAEDKASDNITMTKEQFDSAVQEAVDKALETNAAKQAEAERSDLIAKVIVTHSLTEDIANTIPTPALQELVANSEPKPAPAINTAPSTDEAPKDEFEGYSLNALIRGEKSNG